MVNHARLYTCSATTHDAGDINLSVKRKAIIQTGIRHPQADSGIVPEGFCTKG